MKQLLAGDLVTGMKVMEKDKEGGCLGCNEAHLQKLPSHKSLSYVNKVLEVVHADLCTYQHASYDGNKYMLTLVDHCSGFLWTYALVNKGDATGVIHKWLPYAERYLESRMKTFRSDLGGEFTLNDLQGYFKQLGIYFEPSIPGIPQQNGIPERMNRTINEMVTAVLKHMDVDPHWWSLALPWVTWFHNPLLTRAVQAGETPFIKAMGKKPDLSLLKVFGCMCQYLLPEGQRTKLTPKAKWAVHAGFAKGKKGWKLSDVDSGKLSVSCDCIFYEDMAYQDWLKRKEIMRT